MLTYIIGVMAIGGLFYLMMRKGGGCCGGGGHSMSNHDHGNHEGHDHGHTDTPAEPHSHDHEGTADKDPVCSMTVGPDGPESTFEGRTYRFCSDNCKKTFDDDPAKYA